MYLNPRSASCQSDQCFIKKPVCRYIIVLLLLVTALGIRLHNITKLPLDFSPIREYQNAHIARGLYYETNDSISESRKQVAKLNMERMGFLLEPRIIENASVAGYRLMGAEHLWIPRVLSSIFWVVGGFFLYLIAMKLFSPGISLFSTFFYLFLPYSILASRTFQPDPLMVMMMLFSIYRVMKYDENPTWANLFTAAVIAAVAVFIKPYCVFIIFGGFFSLAVFRKGFWKAVLNRNTIIYGFSIILPAFAYYFSAFGFVGEHAKSSFLPNLLVDPAFWSGWFTMIVQVIGYIAFLLAVIGLFKVKPGQPRALLLGLWAGYFVLGLSATYQIHTHSYYSLPLIPIAALSIAPIAGIFIDRARPLFSKRFMAGFLIFLLLIGFGLFFAIRSLPVKTMFAGHKQKLKTAAIFIGVNPEFGKFLSGDVEIDINMAKEIGEHVGHSPNTLILTPYFGRVIAYHGEFAGLPWPTSDSLYERSVSGARVPDIEKDFTPEHITLLYKGRLIKYTPDFFIITAFEEFKKQFDLRKVLYENYPVLVQNDDYLIFDLRKMSK